jgi:hypothetical protein
VKTIKQTKATTFRFGNQETLESIYTAEIQCRVGGRLLVLRLCVVPGETPLLVSKPMLKALGAQLDMERDEIRFARINVTVPLRVAASGHYQLNLCERKNEDGRRIQTAEVDVMVTAEQDDGRTAEEKLELEEFVAAASSGFR